MEELNFPTPRYSIGDRVIFNPRNLEQYSATELRYVGKLGLVMPTSEYTPDATDIPMIRFDQSERKLPIAQDDLIPHDQEFVPLDQRPVERLERAASNECRNGHERNAENTQVYTRPSGKVERECKICKAAKRARYAEKLKRAKTMLSAIQADWASA